MSDEPEGYEDLFEDLTTTQKIGCVIGNELSMIRGELTRIRGLLEARQTPTEDTRPTFDCIRCLKTMRSEDAAKAHAVDDHGAPPSNWEEVYQDA